MLIQESSQSRERKPLCNGLPEEPAQGTSLVEFRVRGPCLGGELLVEANPSSHSLRNLLKPFVPMKGLDPQRSVPSGASESAMDMDLFFSTARP
jgi:hypothetical protein